MTDPELSELVRRFLAQWSCDLRSRVDPGKSWVESFLGPLERLDPNQVIAPHALQEPGDQSHPSLVHLDHAIASINLDTELGQLAGQLARRVKWRGLYKGGGVAPDLQDGMSAGRIAGPGALIESDKVLAGFFLLAPHVYYPKHDHEALEIYQALSGSTAVTHGIDGTPTHLERGGLSYQAEHVVHDLRVDDEPALLLYLWTGNLGVPTWWWRRDDDGHWWRDCWERQADLTMRKTRSLPVKP